MITSDKRFNTLNEALTWGKFIAENTGWKYKGAKVITESPEIQFAPFWEY